MQMMMERVSRVSVAEHRQFEWEGGIRVPGKSARRAVTGCCLSGTLVQQSIPLAIHLNSFSKR